MELVQSFILSIARTKLSLYEQRIFLKIVEHAQTSIKGQVISRIEGIADHDFDNVKMQLKVSDILSDGSKHYEDVRAAAYSLLGRKLQFWHSGSKTWRAASIIQNVSYIEGRGTIQFYVARLVFDIILDFTKGFSKYDLEAALNLPTAAAVRFYALFNTQSRPLTFSIDNLKEMFGVSDKYAQTADFIKKIVEPSRLALDAAELNSFTYSRVKAGQKVTGLTFFPVRRTQLSEREKAAKLAPSLFLPTEMSMLLIAECGVTTKELGGHKLTLDKFAKLPDAMSRLLMIVHRFHKGNKQKGYLFAAMKSEIEDFEKNHVIL